MGRGWPWLDRFCCHHFRKVRICLISSELLCSFVRWLLIVTDELKPNFDGRRKECGRAFAPEMEHICGRPLGLRFDKKTGDLYIADAYLGLRVVGPSGGVATPVVTEVEGRRLIFTNDMDIDEVEDVIYFTDTSTGFFRR